MKSVLEELVKKLLYTGEMKACRIMILHRASSGDERTIDGIDIRSIENRFLVLSDGNEIPLHRIKKIVKGETILWKR